MDTKQPCQFICVCGKLFGSQKSLSAHMASCREYYLYRDGNLIKYQQRADHLKEKWYKTREERLQNRKRFYEKQREYKMQQWVSEQHKCENCGEVMTSFYGSGGYCSKECSCRRVFSEETKKKISKSLSGRIINASLDRTPKYCEKCGKQLCIKNTSGLCRVCISHRPATDEQKRKQSESMKANGYPIWNIKRSEPSYAEKFFQGVLAKSRIQYQFNYNVKNQNNHFYLLDFFIEKDGKMIDLEIDGKQHEWESRKQHDTIRDKFLSDAGYLVYRIPWNEISSTVGKQEMEEKINNFLIFYHAL